MTILPYNYLPVPLARGLALCVMLAALLIPAFAVAAERGGEAAPPPPQLSEKASETLGQLRPLIDASNWEAALNIAMELERTVTPGTYDQAMANLYVAQIYLMRNSRDMGDYVNAIPRLEHVVNSGYFTNEKQVLDWLFILAQLNAAESNNEKAEMYIKRWLERVPEPTVEGLTFLSQLLYQRAMADEANVDRTALNEALGFVEKALRLGPKIEQRLLHLKVACLLGLDRYAEAGEILELMVKREPQSQQSRTLWQQLFMIYINQEDELRAALTLERAQPLGIMNTPRDYTALVSLYHNMQQFDKEIELLEQALQDGRLDPKEPNNWDLLGYAYQQTHRELKAVQTYERADEHFDHGGFLLKAAQIHLQLQNMQEALRYTEAALKKGVENRIGALLTAAYLALDTEDLEKADGYLKEAQPLVSSDQEKKDFGGLREAVDDRLRRREREQQAQQEGNADAQK